MKRFYRIGPATCVMLALAAPLWAGEPSKADRKSADKPKSQVTTATKPYLGVLVETLHPAFASHLPETLAPNQGVLVSHVEPNSPAAKAGITMHDILVSYDDQKLFAIEQLSKLVASDKPGHEVTLGLVREGKLKTVKVELAAGMAAHTNRHHATGHWWNIPWLTWQPGTLRHELRHPRPTGDAHSQAQPAETFDSLTLKNLGNNRFHVEIQYLDTTGKMQHHQFEGTRDEIHAAIAGEKNLPAGEREHLLRALDMRGDTFPFFGFGDVESF